MGIDRPGDDVAPLEPQRLDDHDWHRATNEGWRHPPDGVATGLPPVTRASARVIDMAEWRREHGARERVRHVLEQP